MKDGIMFSLNKQRRWELPEVLEDIIMKEEQDGDHGVQMVTRHRLMKKANCVSVLATEGIFSNGVVDKDIKSRTKNGSSGYFQLNNILENAPSLTRREIRRRNSRRQPVIEEEIDTPDALSRQKPQIRYEFSFPVPNSSYLAHDAKKVDMPTRTPFLWTGYQDKKGSNRRRNGLKDDIKESVHIMQDEEAYSESECDEQTMEDLASDEDRGRPQNEHDIALNDLLLHANNVKSILHGKRRNSQETCGQSEKSKDRKLVFVDQEETSHVTTTETINEDAIAQQTETISYVESIPVKVILSNGETDPVLLTERFADKITEGSCYPRRFVLDISNRLNKLDGLKTYRQDTTRAQAYLVFVQNSTDAMNTMKESVFEIHLNAHFNDAYLKYSKLETIFDYMETHIEEVIERTLFYIQTLPMGAIWLDDVVLDYKSKNSQKAIVKNLLHSHSQCYAPTDQYVLKFMNTNEQATHVDGKETDFEVVSYFDALVADNSNDVTSPSGRFCAICFEELGGFVELGFDKPGMALGSCGHWFCDSCWRNHMYTQIQNGAMKLECPEFECKTQVDYATMISFVNIKCVIQLARRVHDNFVQTMPQTKWCPNKTCGRVIHLEDANSEFASCACGTKFCVRCQSSPHWPAPCEIFSQYAVKIRNSGDSSMLPPEAQTDMAVNVASCPHCQRLVQKNGGCPYMYCVCRRAFCWGCKKPWEGKTHGTECYKSGARDLHGTKTIRLEVDDLRNRNRVGWYKNALYHRSNQHSARMSRIKTVVRAMTKDVGTTLNKTAKKGRPINLEGYDLPVSLSTSFDVGKQFLMDTVEMYSEINHVVENTSVLLGTSGLDTNFRRKLNNLSARLSTLADIIFTALTVGATGEREVRDMLERLASVRRHARNAILVLLRTARNA